MMLLIPYAVACIASNVAGCLTDLLLRLGWRLVTVRKLMNGVGCAGSTLAFFLFASFGHSTSPAKTVVCASIGFSSVAFALAGFWANIADLSKEVCGVLLGLTNTIATLPGVLVNVSTGDIVQHIHSGWSVVFLAAIPIELLGQALYMMWASSDIQF